MRKNPNPSDLSRRRFLSRCGWFAAGSALNPLLANAGSKAWSVGAVGAAAKPYGSGYFGAWITDEFGLPAFHYTCDQTTDPKAVSPVDPVFRAPTDQTHQVGNDRLVAAVSNYGYVQVRQDEGSPKFLNDYSPERGQFGAGIGYLTDGKVLLGTFYPGTGESFDRIFGVGYLQKKITGGGYAIDQVLFAPFGDDPVMVSQVTITNRGGSPASLRWIEYWGCHPYQFSYRSMMEANVEGSRDRGAELRRKFGDRFAHHFQQVERGHGLLETKHFLGRTAEDQRLWQDVKDALAVNAMRTTLFGAQGLEGMGRMEDLKPPGTFLVSLDGPAQGFATNGKAFFGSGGALRPAGLSKELDGDLNTGGPEGVMLMERKIRLEPGESRTLRFLYGYLPKGTELSSLTGKYRNEGETSWARSSKKWKQSGLRFETKSAPWAERELTWSHYYVRSNLTYDDFFDEHILSQGQHYQYIAGLQGAARDPLQHALPFVFSDPQIVKEIVRYTLKEVRPDGSIPYAIVGHGVPMPTSQDDASDLPLWLIWVASEYVMATRDFAFLDQEIPAYPFDSPSSSKESVREILARCYRYLINCVGTGPHGLMRMLMDDWLDALVFQAVPLKWRAEYVKVGESVLNSAMASYVFDLYAAVLTGLEPKSELAADARKRAEEHRQAVRAQWTGRWFRRAWLGPKVGWIGDDTIWIEPQSWAILGGAASPDQSRALVCAIDEQLRRPSPIGAMRWSPGLHPEKGKSHPGARARVCASLNGTLIWALSTVNKSMAWDEWKKNLLAAHAEAYPDVWYGTWSGPDVYNGVLQEDPGRIGSSWPVMNMHPHAWPLYSASRVLGIEFTPKGVNLKPALPLEAYRFTSPLFGFEKSDRGYEGWYAPHGRAGKWLITIRLPQQDSRKLSRKRVNGSESPLEPAPDGSMEIEGESAPGTPLRWSLMA